MTHPGRLHRVGDGAGLEAVTRGRSRDRPVCVHLDLTDGVLVRPAR